MTEEEQSGKQIESEANAVIDSKEFKGLMADKVTETGRRQEAEQNLSTANQQLNEANSTIAEMRASKETVSEEATDDSEFLTRGQLNAELDKKAKADDERAKKLQQGEQEKRYAASESEAKKEFTAEKYGEGLDYATVTKIGTAAMCQQNPGHLATIRLAPNPAEEAYRIGLLHPDFAGKADKAKTQKLLDDLSTGNTSQSGASVQAADLASMNEQDQFEELLKLPDDQMEKALRESCA